MTKFEELLERAETESIAIHTATEDQAIALLEALDKKGYRWNSGRNLTDNTRYGNHKNTTCYIFGIGSYSNEVVMYGPLDCYQEECYTIIECGDIDFKEE